MSRIHCRFSILLALFLGIFVMPELTHADATGDITATPTNIGMGAQYDGLHLQVNGTVPAGSDVILRFIGATDELHLRKKGKVFGLLWMNVGKVTLKNVPKVCLIDSSREFTELGDVAIPYRLDGLRTAIEVEGDGSSDTLDVPSELLLLKQHEGLYSESAKGVTLGADNGTTRTFSADLAVPSALAPGAYQVEAVALKNGAVVGTYATAVEARLIGFPKWLSNMAFQKSLLYGVLATLIAIFSGLAIGMVFQSKGSH
jgi:uncharacterized protein (TIGR02186 family)